MTEHMNTPRRSDRVLITGAASGIGFATAQRLGRAGARLGLFDRSADQVQTARDSLSRDGVESLAFAGDVRQRTDLAGTVDAIVERWGGLDAAICAAGILRVGPLATLDMAQWDEVMDVNLKGVLLTCQEVIRVMQDAAAAGAGERARRRKIVIVGSTAAANPKVGLGAYATAKVALVQLTRVFASELAGAGVNVNAVAPGTIRTPMTAAPPETSGDSGFRFYGSANRTDRRARGHREQHRVPLLGCGRFHHRRRADDRRRHDGDISRAMRRACR
jgi:3-oxoacyl-[acyl-carrier protein] reductase